ncbi:hypothetical protein [Aurantiacibacter aquimixticola]|uniref:hypothetical protein n=1 Tax=Aurantiacibacter aquimixticola TaxID=1958945 RepID=UPI001403238A|nr:hypothetical protein [Aurantiacibacter aquimixticola]
MEFELVEGRDIHQPVAGREGPSNPHIDGPNADPEEATARRRSAIFIPEQAQG